METINFLPILAILMALATLGVFIYFEFDLLQPSGIFFLVMTISLFLGVFSMERWNLYVGPDTSLVVIGGMFAFLTGAVFLHDCFCKGCRGLAAQTSLGGRYRIPVPVVAGCTLLVLVLAFLSGKELYELSVSLGNHDGLSNMIKTLRYPLERGEIRFSRWNSYREVVSTAVAISFLYFFVYNMIVDGKKKLVDFLLLCPVAAYVPILILSTGRRSMVHFVISGLVLCGILYQQKYGASIHVQKRICKILSIAGVFAVGMYFLFGFLTGKVSVGGRDPLTIISHYGGLSVPALELYVSSIRFENQYILQNTMMGIYGNLNSLGFDLEPGRGFLPFVRFEGVDVITTNVYTIFYRLLADYSFPGLLVVMFLFGILLTYAYDWLKRNDSPVRLAIYAYYGYIPFFLFIDDQFMGLATTRTLYLCFSIWCVIHIMRRYYEKAPVIGNKV